MQNKYPGFPSHPNAYNQQYPQVHQSEPIQVGVPVIPNQQFNAGGSYPPIHNAMPYPEPVPSMNIQQQGANIPYAYSYHNQPHHQMPSDHYHQGNQQFMPQAQHKGYAELHNQEDYDTEENQGRPHTQINMQYPENPMVNPMTMANPQFRPLGAEMIPVVYDASFFQKATSREPQLIQCKKCNKIVQSIVKYQVGTGTLISSAFVAFFGAIPCAWVPCCLKDLKDAVHYCPVCGDEIGKKKFLVN